MPEVPKPYSYRYAPGGGTGHHLVEGPGGLKIRIDSRKEREASIAADELNEAFREGWAAAESQTKELLQKVVDAAVQERARLEPYGQFHCILCGTEWGERGVEAHYGGCLVLRIKNLLSGD
jgi:hypothetical protein